MKYDYLIVGAGFFGAVFARVMTDAGKKCLVIDSRPHIAGNCYSEKVEGIDVHMYGPHIFHTNSEEIWEFVNRYSKFEPFELNVKANYNGRIYSLPFNMNTFNEVWGITRPEEAKVYVENFKAEEKPKNLEEHAKSMIGSELYEMFVKGYTKKQWKRDPKDLPSSIIKRLPIRFTYNNNYFNDKYQGIPSDGYTKLFENLLEGIEVRLNTNFNSIKNNWRDTAENLVYTGKIDEYFDYCFGELEYRTQDFEHKTLQTDNFQGNAIINYCNENVPYTRIIEHKHFLKKNTEKTVITMEYPVEWSSDKIPMYPINDEKNDSVFRKYEELTKQIDNVIFGGRLAEYKYYDMHMVIGSALKTAKLELHKYNINI